MPILEGLQAARIRRAAPCCIYGLLDPLEPDHIRYVGQSFYPGPRYVEHLSGRGRNRRPPTPKEVWLARLSEGGRKPELVLLEKGVSPIHADERENYWIVRLRRKGHQLTNAAVPVAR